MPAGADLQVTDYKLKDATHESMAAAINDYLKSIGIEPQEYGYSACKRKPQDEKTPIPERYRWLLSFFVEGGSEGYYCHVGFIVQPDGYSLDPTTYHDVCFCKTWDQESAGNIARAVQRFLVNAEWN